MNTFIGHKPDNAHLQALARCKRGDEKLMELFADALERTKESLVDADDPQHINRLQGRAKVLQDFLSAVDKADGILERR